MNGQVLSGIIKWSSIEWDSEWSSIEWDNDWSSI